jgi:hypothetical protein
LKQTIDPNCNNNNNKAYLLSLSLVLFIQNQQKPIFFFFLPNIIEAHALRKITWWKSEKIILYPILSKIQTSNLCVRFKTQ